MKFLTTILASTALLTPLTSAWSCLSDADAQSIVARSRTFLMHTDVAAATDAADSLYIMGANQFFEYSDSINSLREAPLGVPIYTNVSAYISDELQNAPPIPVINTIALIHDCSQLVWYWEFQGIGGPGKQRVRGMSLTTVDQNAKVLEHQIEFNSLAWAINIGYNVTAPADY